jgi:hypothetical protein
LHHETTPRVPSVRHHVNHPTQQPFGNAMGCRLVQRLAQTRRRSFGIAIERLAL